MSHVAHMHFRSPQGGPGQTTERHGEAASWLVEVATGTHTRASPPVTIRSSQVSGCTARVRPAQGAGCELHTPVPAVQKGDDAAAGGQN